MNGNMKKWLSDMIESDVNKALPVLSFPAVQLMKKCCGTHKNFVISSGCDIPPMFKWPNIDAFFQAVTDFYKG